MSNINQFIANTPQLASPARFMVMFGKMASIFPRPLLMKCNLSSLPGFSLGIMERKVYGPNRKFPFSQNYQELTMSFYCSPDHKERAGFEKWFSKIYDKKYFDYGFYNDYVDNLTIIQLGWDNKQTYKIQLMEAFPNLISPIELDYSQQNAFERFDVSFVYHRYQAPGDVGATGVGNPTSLLPAALSGLGATLPSSLTGFLGDLPSNLLGGLTGPLSGILSGGGIIGDVLGGAQDIIGIVQDGVDFVDSIVGAVNDSASIITGLISDINAVSGIVGVSLIPPSVANGILSGVSSVNSTLGNAANYLSDVASGAQQIIDLPNQVATGLLTAAGTIETSVNRAFSGAVNAINIADSVISDTLGIMSEAEIAISGIVQPFVDAAAGVETLLTNNDQIAADLKGLFDANIY